MQSKQRMTSAIPATTKAFMDATSDNKPENQCHQGIDADTDETRIGSSLIANGD